jgi:sterol desaturase/sphingolipid hydroxylase (fatty acid hydroxylase superfamily)
MNELLALAQSYFFWLVVISVGFFGAERLWPARPEQSPWRKQFAQDVFWLIWNGRYVGVILALAADRLIWPLAGGAAPRFDTLLGDWPAPLQFIALLVVVDLLDWMVHNLLHRVPVLWAFHKVHHSITDMDFLGAFRFHWMEPVIYNSLKFTPLLWLQVDPGVAFAIAITQTVFGHWNHSNLRFELPGVLSRIFNSPGFHLWHHAATPGRARNFAVIFSAWDYLAGTAYAPPRPPGALGFEVMEDFPKSLPGRLLFPLSRLSSLASRRRSTQ